MLNFDEGRMSSTMGLPRIMQWLQVLERSDRGPVKLGHGKLTLRYTVTQDLDHVRLTMKLWEDVSVENVQVEQQCQKSVDVLVANRCFSRCCPHS